MSDAFHGETIMHKCTDLTIKPIQPISIREEDRFNPA